MILSSATASGPIPGGISSGDSNDRQQRLIFSAGGRLCAVPISQVVETMRALPLKAVADAPPFVRGLSVIRGEPVVVIDVALLIGDRPSEAARFITVRTGKRIVAIAADVVARIFTPADDDARQMPPVLGEAASDAIAAVGRLDAELLFFLSGVQLVPEELIDGLLQQGAQS